MNDCLAPNSQTVSRDQELSTPSAMGGKADITYRNAAVPLTTQFATFTTANSFLGSCHSKSWSYGRKLVRLSPNEMEGPNYLKKTFKAPELSNICLHKSPRISIKLTMPFHD